MLITKFGHFDVTCSVFFSLKNFESLTFYFSIISSQIWNKRWQTTTTFLKGEKFKIRLLHIFLKML